MISRTQGGGVIGLRSYQTRPLKTIVSTAGVVLYDS